MEGRTSLSGQERRQIALTVEKERGRLVRGLVASWPLLGSQLRSYG